ncbi:MAG: hypothetical protein A3G41_01805 [Elusimicrobia bacterium RIFCSPLOWO2_12_FULL_59_9]|nr:MAG: hypothetical protein A3G41_01805 [Elusimicrobia bacterium RIFCSPLOWO2_12_FULL_59_9]
MLENALFILVGALLHSLFTRNYDQYRGREGDSHLLKLAAEEVGEFFDELDTWESFLEWHDELRFIRAIRLDTPINLANQHIKHFLKTPLSFLLFGEVRNDLKAISDLVEMLNSLNDAQSRDRLGDEKRTMALGQIRLYQTKLGHEIVCRIWNAILYTTSTRFKWLGLKPSENHIRKARTVGELAFLKVGLMP